MATPDAFAGKLNALLEEFPNSFSLPECQYLYRRVIFSMGLAILERFQDDLAGPDPFESNSAFDATEVLSPKSALGRPILPANPVAGGGGGTGTGTSPAGGGQGPGIEPDASGPGQGPGIDPCVVFVGVVLGVTEPHP